jgi:hypothetical protein
MRGRYRGWPHRLWLPSCAAILALATAYCCPTRGGPDADEVPAIRRILLQPEQVQTELARVREGVWVQRSREDFEALVKSARAAGAARKVPPRLIEVQYSADLVETALVGRGYWKVINPAPSPGTLSLQPLNLALANVKLQAEGGGAANAVLGRLDGKGSGLLVDKSGEQTVLFDWTARGEPGPDGLHFQLDMPPCAVTVLELTLPPDHIITKLEARRLIPFLETRPGSCLLVAPADGEAGNRVWRIHCPGQSLVDFHIRPSPDKRQPAPLVLARQQTRQELTPGLLKADYDFQVEVLYNSLRELRLVCDAPLRPYDVQIRGLKGWEILEGLSPTAPSTLIVRLNEPLQGGPVPLRVRCRAPLNGGTAWTSPALRLMNGLWRGEALTVVAHPDVQLDNWQSGSYRFTSPALKSAGSKASAGDKLILHLFCGQEQTNVQRPGAWIRSPDVEFRARQLAWWQIGPEQTSLTTQITYEVARGRLFRLPLRLPPGWKIERVELTPTDLLQQWSPPSEHDRTLVVDLQRPVGPTAPARLTLRLRSEGLGTDRTPRLRPVPLVPPLLLSASCRSLFAGVLGGAATSSETAAAVLPAHASLALPDVVPLGARLHEGALAISLDPVYQRPAVPPFAPEERGPWGDHTLDYYYPYRGQSPAGKLDLQPRPARISARCTNKVILAAGRATVGARLVVQAEAGRPEALDVYLSVAPSRRWEWKTAPGSNAVRDRRRLEAVETAPRLGALAARSPWEAVALLASRPPPGQAWRLYLERPLREHERLILETTLELAGRDAGGDGPDGQRVWEVPLLTVPAADRMEGLVTVDLAEADSVQVTANGLEETRTDHQAPARSSWRTFRYGHTPATLILHGRAPAVTLAAEAVFDRARLTTYVEPHGRLLHRFGFQVANWPQPELRVRLPAGSKVLAARVDRRWITPASLPARSAADKVEVGLPMPTGAAPHRFEIVYAEDMPSWTLVADLTVPAPELPVSTPVAFRRTWCLPPGVAPLTEETLRRLPGSAGRAESDSAAGDFVGLRAPRSALRAVGVPLPEEEWRTRQEEALAGAGAKLREAQTRSGKEWLLGDALDELAFSLLAEQGPLVLDETALRQAGLGPATRLPQPSPTWRPGEPLWPGLEVVYVLCQPAPLLTTRRQLEVWRAAESAEQPLSASLTEAVAEAARLDQDSTGRFGTVVDWLRPGEDVVAGDATPPALLVPDSFGADWTEWEPLAGAAAPETLRVVRQSTLPVFGLVLAALCLLALGAVSLGSLRRDVPRAATGGAALARPRRRVIGLVLGWLAASGLALLWLPPALRELAWWPALVGLVVAGACLWPAARGLATRRPSGSSARAKALAGSGAAVVLALIWLAEMTGQAAAPSPVTVFIVPGPAEAPEKQTVLAPPTLLDQLKALAERQTPALQGAFLVAARYEEGLVTDVAGDVRARFVANYQVASFGEKPATLQLPLGGVELQAAFFDGARAYPVPLSAPQTGYRLEVDKAGSHFLRLEFSVRVAADGKDRDLTFTIPEVVQSQLSLSVPGAAKNLHAVFGRGRQTIVETKAGQKIEKVDLKAELGPIRTVHVNWRQDDPEPQAPVVQLRESYFWDLRATDSRLLAALRYTVRQGTVTSLALDLPAALEVRRVETGSVGSGKPAPPLQDSFLTDTGKQRRLQLDFRRPIAGEVQVVLELVPREPPFGPKGLPLPTPADAQGTEGLLAYRVEGLEAADPKYRGVTFYDTQAFADHWRSTGADNPGKPARAYSFRRPQKPSTNDQGLVSPYLQLDLRPAVVQAHGDQQVHWQLGRRQAEVRVTARLTARGGALVLAEWQVPAGVSLAEVRGRDVRQWTRTDTRVQVWFERPVAETTVQLTGWLPRPEQGPPARFDLPCVLLRTAQTQTTLVRLTAVDNQVLEPVHPQGLQPAPQSRTSEWERAYVAEHAQYGGTFQTRPAHTDAEARVLTNAFVRDRNLTFVATVEYRVQKGELRKLIVHLRHWKGRAVQLEADQVAQRQEDRRDPDDRVWVLDLQPGVTGSYRAFPVLGAGTTGLLGTSPGQGPLLAASALLPRRTVYRLTLRGTVPVEEAGDVLMPDVSVDGVVRQERWLAVARPELRTADPLGLEPLAGEAADRALSSWPHAMQRQRQVGGWVWQIASDRWRLRLQPRPVAARITPVQVFLTEQAAALMDDRRWLHQATYWLFHEAGTELQVRLPAGARLLAVAIDGAAVPPLQPSSGHLWLPLPGGAGARRVTLQWTFDPDTEALARPDLEPPHLEGDGLGRVAPDPAGAAGPVPPQAPVLWTVHVPAGYRLNKSEGNATAVGAVRQDLWRAEAELRLSKLLAERAQGGAGDAFRPQLRAAQERFYRYCRQAEYHLAVAPEGDGQNLRSQLEAKKEQNRKQLAGFPELRAQAESETRLRLATVATAPDWDDAALGPTLGMPAGLDSLPQRGTPIYWQTTAANPTPRVTLTPLPARPTVRFTFASVLLLLLLMGLGGRYSGSPRGLWWLWPEALVVLACLGWPAFGLGLASCLLMLGVCGRLVALARGLLHLLRPRAPAAAATPAAGS